MVMLMPGNFFAPQTAGEFMARAAGHARAGRYEAALSDYDEAIRRAPHRAATYLARADHNLEQGDYAAAAADSSETLSVLAEQDKWRRRLYEAQARRIRASARLALGDLTGAEDDYSALIALSRRRAARAEARLGRAAVRGEQGAFAAVLEDVQAALREAGHLVPRPLLAMAHGLRGWANAQLHGAASARAALADCHTALRLTAGSAAHWRAEAFALRGRARAALGDVAGGLDDCTIAAYVVRRQPAALASALRRRAALYQQAGDTVAAHADLSAALSGDPGAAWTRVLRAGLNDDADGDLGTVADLRARAAHDRQRRAFSAGRGVVLSRRNALIVFCLALALGALLFMAATADQRAALARFNLGSEHFQFGEYTAAIGFYDQAIALDPTFADAFNARGLARWHLQELSSALADFDTALRLDPHHRRAYYNRGFTRYALADTDGAIADFTQAIALDSAYANAYVSRGIAYAESGQRARATADFRRALELAPTHPRGEYMRQKLRDWSGEVL